MNRAHSAAAIPSPTATNSAEWRKFLQQERAELQRQYQEHGRAATLLNRHSKLIDNVLNGIWRQSALPDSIALVAVGGYGRGQLYPYSDIDLLFLLPATADETTQQSLERLIGLLWDIGLEVGHSVRTLPECLEEAAKDTTVQTNLLESRFLAGDCRLYREFDNIIRSRLDRRLFFEAKYLEQQQRHARFHDTAYNLEPNLKESPGGLRDLQSILWIGQAIGCASWPALVRESLISAQEARQIGRHETLLQNLRIRLHYLAGRREDRLLFDHQTTLAMQFGWGESGSRRPSEQLMQRYYRTVKAVGLFNEILLRNLQARIFPEASVEAAPLSPRFQARNGLLELRDNNLFQREPTAILESFLTLQQHPELGGMSASTLRALWRAVPGINASFRHDPHNRALFMEILRQPRGITHELRHMNQYGVLGRYIPAFGRIVGQMQHDLFHVYTVDEHTLFVVRNLRRFTVPEFAHEFPLCSRLASDFERPEVLYIAGLFHDIAKGRGGDHSTQGATEVRRFCKTHGLGKEDTELASWLVTNHLVMSATAQKQDLSDPDVIAAFASRVSNMRHLTALYLLTVADIRGTSPSVWNAWKGKLLEDLFRATQRHLSGGAPAAKSQLQARQIETLEILQLYALEKGAQETLWAQLDEGYFLRHEAQEIAWHTRKLYRQENTALPLVRARLSPSGEGIQAMIYTHDRDDLFARICSFFERADFNIVEAKIHTTRHGYALDSFVVLDETNRSAHYRDLLNFIEYELAQQLAGETPLLPPLQGRLSRHLKHFPITPEVAISPDDKGQYHVLSIIAGDRPGLLSHVARILLRHEIHLHTAKIATLGERAEDTFLITGERLNDQKAVVRLEVDLLEALRT